jgi:hypothetical protein
MTQTGEVLSLPFLYIAESRRYFDMAGLMRQLWPQ